jgi:3',5'-cyclic AMP phosphodiesterase CpdA
MLSVLHLSDIHIGNTFRDESIEDIAIRTVDDIKKHVSAIDCIIVTGDIFEGSVSHDIYKAKSFFEILLKRLNKGIAPNLRKEDFVFVPGNHDLRRDHTNNSANFDEYKKFLKCFQSEDYFKEYYDNELLYTIKIYEKQKVIVIGFNSCMLEHNNADDIKWVDEIKWDNVGEEFQELMRMKIKEHYQSKWDDYGKISQFQLSEVFDKLESKVLNVDDYTLVACFHHHFYPFPENYTKIGDCSLMRNFDAVIKKLQMHKVKIVLHGHKHLPIIRPVTNQKFLWDPNSIIYVFSAGSFSKEGAEQSFQVIEVYCPKENEIAKVTTFNYKGKDLIPPRTYVIPLDENINTKSINILERFNEKFSIESKSYQTEIKDRDNVSSKYKFSEILKNIGDIITPFDNIKKDLVKSPEKNLIIMLSVHYRINIFNNLYNKSTNGTAIIKDIQKYFIHIKASDSYKRSLFTLLETCKNSKFKDCYTDIEKNSNRDEKIFTAYASIAIFFTDLYLTLSEYGKFYYFQEGINANIKFPEDDFHRNIPSHTIHMYSDIDKRSSFVEFKCTDPTAHKIAVLIIKNFEKRLNYLEESFRILNLKIYYLTPKIEKNRYELEDYNFEAYIPTLLPLLTGENLYKQKEVFIRELIQNSLDAILLREQLNSSSSFNTNIKIEFGIEKIAIEEKSRRYLRIIDEGIGMDIFRIERYFTSIGRSYYVSEEYFDLIKNKGVTFEPISNFGIGFLSAFMVCKEINVITKSCDENSTTLEIYIPNYDGCFFINKKMESETKIGTSITLYADDRNRLNFDKIKKYLMEVILDLPIKIEIYDSETDCSEEILPHNLKRDKKISLFVPMNEDGLKQISWKEEVKTGYYIDKYNYGLLVNFDLKKGGNKKIYLNAGIKLSESDEEVLKNYYCDQYYNFPASYIQLDVAREKLKKFKNGPNYYNNRKMIQLLTEQADELIAYIIEEKNEFPLIICNNVYSFLSKNVFELKDKSYNDKLCQIKKRLYHLNIKRSSKLIRLTLQSNRNEYVNRRNIIDSDINEEFDIISLFLLKCFMMETLFKDADNRELLSEIQNIIQILETFQSKPLYYFKDLKTDHELKDIINKIIHFEAKYSNDINKLTRHIFENKSNPVHRHNALQKYSMELYYMLNRGFLREFNALNLNNLNFSSIEKLQSILQSNFDRYAENMYSDITKTVINIKEVNEIFKSVLFLLFISVSRNITEYERNRAHDHISYVLENYISLCVFYKVLSIIRIDQINNFFVEFSSTSIPKYNKKSS